MTDMTEIEKKHFLKELEAIERKIEWMRNEEIDYDERDIEELEERMQVINYEPVDYCANCLLGKCLEHE